MFYNEPWLDTDENGKEFYRAPTWRERWHRFRVHGGFIGIAAIAAFIAIMIGSFSAVHASEAKTAAAVSEARATILARLNEDGIPAFEGGYHLEFITFTDTMHPWDPTIQHFNIVGVKSTDEAEIYYLVDLDGYISTLTFARSGMPTWLPDCKTDSTELDINPKYESAARHFLEGDLSVRFVMDETSAETSTPVRPAGAAPYDGPVIP